MKTAQDYLDAANAEVTRITAQEAIEKHAAGRATFIDVRDSGDIAKSGTIAGAHRVPRNSLAGPIVSQAAGVTDKLWEVSDIVALIEAKEAERPMVRGPYKKGK